MQARAPPRRGLGSASPGGGRLRARTPRPPAAARPLAPENSSPCTVHLAVTPLVGLDALTPLADVAVASGWAGGAAAALAPHAVVVVQCAGGACHAFDFLPAHPQSPATVATLLAGGSVAAVGRERVLARLPATRVAHVGAGSDGTATLAAARAAVARWGHTKLRLMGPDCRTEAVALAAALAGVPTAAAAAALDAAGAASRRRERVLGEGET